MKITTKQVSNSPVTFVTRKRFAVLFFLASCCVNSLILNEDEGKLALSTTKNIYFFTFPHPFFAFPHFCCFHPPPQPHFHCFPSARGYDERCEEKKAWLRKSFNRIEKNCVTNQTDGCSLLLFTQWYLLGRLRNFYYTVYASTQKKRKTLDLFLCLST